MSSHGHENTPAVTEVAPLIPRSRTRSKSKDGPRILPTTLVIPIAIISRLAILLTATTTLDIYRKIACLLYYNLNEPGSVPPAGGIPDELCRIREVNSYYAAIVSISAVVDGIGIIIACGAASYIGSRFGRKPALVALFFVSIIGRSLLVAALNLGGWVQLSLMGLWSFSEAITNPVSLVFVFNMYIVDIAEATERTAALSKFTGWSTLGGALSFSLGGWITAQINDLTGVYIISIAVHIVTCIYILAVLPESFPPSKREELRHQREATGSTSSRGWARKMLSSLIVAFEPLELLKPTYDSATGRPNWRLVYCAIHIFVVTVADGYASTAMIVYFSARFLYSPAETGYLLTTLSITSVIVLTFFIPAIVNRLRPYYVRKQLYATPPEASTVDRTIAIQEEILEISDHMDVHIAFGSWVIESVAYIAIGFMNTLGSQLTAVAGIGFGAGRTPVFLSLVAASVDPLVQGALLIGGFFAARQRLELVTYLNISAGEALAAIEMIASIGMILSPIVMGSIITSTINTIPQMIFYVHAAIILVGASVLFLIRDSDRFHIVVVDSNPDRLD